MHSCFEYGQKLPGIFLVHLGPSLILAMKLNKKLLAKNSEKKFLWVCGCSLKEKPSNAIMKTFIKACEQGRDAGN